MKLRAIFFILCLMGSLVFAPSASAQLASQTALVGTVTDSGGGVLPGATGVAVNTGTKDTYEATTNAQGQYNIQFVRPGRYDITVSMQGFQTSRTTGIELTTNQIVRTNAALQVGAVSEEVVVEGRAAVLATDQATVSDTIDAQQLTELIAHIPRPVRVDVAVGGVVGVEGLAQPGGQMPPATLDRRAGLPRPYFRTR